MKPKSNPSRCVVDNWTLECSAVLLEEGVDAINASIMREYFEGVTDSILLGSQERSVAPESFYGLDMYFGALANLLTAIVTFDEVIFVENGFEKSWQRFPQFSKSLSNTLYGRKFLNSNLRRIDQKFAHSADPGILYYCCVSDSFKADLLLNPIRSKHVMEKKPSAQHTYGEYTSDLLKVLDIRLKDTIDSSGSGILAGGVLPNLTMPVVASLVFSQATQRRDILDTALDIRNSSQARNFRKILGTCVGDIRASTRYPQLVEGVSKAIRSAIRDTGIFDPDDKIGSIGLNVFVVSFSYDIGKRIEPNILFLRDLARCRLELLGSKHHVKRLFDYVFTDTDRGLTWA